MGSTWDSPGSCRPQMGPMLAPWILLSGRRHFHWGDVVWLLRCLGLSATVCSNHVQANNNNNKIIKALCYWSFVQEIHRHLGERIVRQGMFPWYNFIMCLTFQTVILLGQIYSMCTYLPVNLDIPLGFSTGDFVKLMLSSVFDIQPQYTQRIKLKAAMIIWLGHNYFLSLLCPYDLPLTQLPLNKMAIISQMTFLNTFSWMKTFVFRFKVLIDNKPVLVQVMAWRRIGDKPLSEPMLIQFTDAYMRGDELKIMDKAKWPLNERVVGERYI